jgi:hypothetical protein
MTLRPTEKAPIPLSTDDEIEACVADLIGGAILPHMWLLFIGDDGELMPPVTQIDDMPAFPQEGDERCLTAMADTLSTFAIAAVVVVRERPGGAPATDADRAWGRMIALAFARSDLTLRGQLLSHDHGVRWLRPDDYV